MSARACASVAALLGLLADGTSIAHHSFGAFAMDERITIEGVIVEFEWTHPHTTTSVDVTNGDGPVTRWALEGMSPTDLGRRGWTRYTLRPGDRVAIVVAPLKSGEPGGAFIRVRLEDGTEKLMLGGR